MDGSYLPIISFYSNDMKMPEKGPSKRRTLSNNDGVTEKKRQPPLSIHGEMLPGPLKNHSPSLVRNGMMFAFGLYICSHEF